MRTHNIPQAKKKLENEIMYESKTYLGSASRALKDQMLFLWRSK